MPVRIVCYDNNPPQGWDKRVYNAKEEGGLCQSTYWARIIEKIDRARSIYLEVFDGRNNKITASLVILKKIPWDRGSMQKKRGIREMITGKWRGWLEWQDGPVVYSRDKIEIQEAISALLEWVDSYGRTKKLYNILSNGFTHTSRFVSDGEIAKLFVRYGYSASRWGTYLVDLRLKEDELWRKIKSSARKSINKARGLGISLRAISSFDEYVNLYFLSYCKFKSIAGSMENMSSVWKIAWDEDIEKYYRYYVAETANGEVMATLGMNLFNGVATEVASSLNPKAFKDKIPAQDILHWEMILEAKRTGCNTFNLAGVNPRPQNAKEEGIRRFKEKWGGEYIETYRFGKRF